LIHKLGHMHILAWGSVRSMLRYVYRLSSQGGVSEVSTLIMLSNLYSAFEHD